MMENPGIVLCYHLGNKKDAGRPYDHFRGGIAPRSLLCVGKRRMVFSSKSVVLLLLGPMGPQRPPKHLQGSPKCRQGTQEIPKGAQGESKDTPGSTKYYQKLTFGHLVLFERCNCNIPLRKPRARCEHCNKHVRKRRSRK